jgi:hypothetical protein
LVLTLALTSARELKPILPPKARGFIKPLVLTLSLPSARELKPFTPPLPSPSAHLKDKVFIKPWFYRPKARGFIKPLVLTFTLHPLKNLSLKKYFLMYYININLTVDTTR